MADDSMLVMQTQQSQVNVYNFERFNGLFDENCDDSINLVMPNPEKSHAF